MVEVKRFANYEEQIEILRKHGCIIDDDIYCREKLLAIGYYRLSAYFLPFKQLDGSYLAGTRFETVYRIYEFDRKLRSLLFMAIEVIEIALRSQVSYFYSSKYGSLGYKQADNFNSKHNHERFESNLNREIANNDKVAFVKHHADKYGGNFPIWVITELFTFGMLSYFYNDLKTTDKKSLARQMGLNYRELSSWLRCCTQSPSCSSRSYSSHEIERPPMLSRCSV